MAKKFLNIDTGTPKNENVLVEDVLGLSSTITTITLSSGSWVLNSGLYTYDYSNASILSSSVVDVIPNNTNIDIVIAAQILPYILVSNGSIKLYAKNAPTGNISVNIVIGV